MVVSDYSLVHSRCRLALLTSRRWRSRSVFASSGSSTSRCALETSSIPRCPSDKAMSIISETDGGFSRLYARSAFAKPVLPQLEMEKAFVR